MRADEVEDFDIDKKFYDAHPERFFVQYELNDNICEDRGFLTIGTAGCAYDNGVIITGKMRGKYFRPARVRWNFLRTALMISTPAGWTNWQTRRNIGRRLKEQKHSEENTVRVTVEIIDIKCADLRFEGQLRHITTKTT
ncbi:hypothetical protein [Ruminococcus albus]|uniref:hypothetical protein n=1 Tax=Ruminococcus albus TaxID=1264 RepID=UPI00046358DE|nr:hypothetical protein [Ruminococcus albus]